MAPSPDHWFPSANCPNVIGRSPEQWTSQLRRTGILGICRSWVSFRNASVAAFSGLAQRSLHSDQGAINEERDVWWVRGGDPRGVGGCRCARSQDGRQNEQDEVRDELH